MAARWIYHAHEFALGYKKISSGVDNKKQKKACHRESLIQDEAPGGSAHLTASLRVTTKCQRRLELSMNPNVVGGSPAVRRVAKGSWSAVVGASEEQFATHLDMVQHIRETAGTKRGADDDMMVCPVKRAHTISLSVDPGPVACGYWDKSDAAAGEFGDHNNGEVLDRSLKITRTNDEITRDREDCSAHAKTQVQETVDREGYPHERVQQIQEKPGHAERHDTR